MPTRRHHDKGPVGRVMNGLGLAPRKLRLVARMWVALRAHAGLGVAQVTATEATQTLPDLCAALSLFCICARYTHTHQHCTTMIDPLTDSSIDVVTHHAATC